MDIKNMSIMIFVWNFMRLRTLNKLNE